MRVATSTGAADGRVHPHLANVHRIIVDGSCSVLSLDIFDTVLWRKVPRPADVFGLLGARLRASGLSPEWITDASFRRMRIAAEEKARLSRDALGTEVSLFDIWRAMPDSLFDKGSLDELVAAEVAIERELTVVDLDIAGVIRLAREHEVRLVLISDTYFTEEHLAHLLDRAELGPMRDVTVFRSHQHGVDKANGLWEVVLNELGLSAEQVVHIGDNEIADVKVPAKLGVRTVHYRRLDEGYETVLTRERQSLDPFGPYADHLDEREGDFGLTSLRAKTLQAGSASTTSAVDTAWRYGAAVLGPVLTGFAEWVAYSAHEAGTKVLWCPMREGELLSELINTAARARGLDVEARPVWLSRHVTAIAGLDQFDFDAVYEFIRRSYLLTVRQLLSILHLRAGEVPSLAGELDRVIDSGLIAERVSTALTESPHIRNRLTVTATAARERMIKVLRDIGALNNPEMTLVDLGWGGTIQLQLAKVLGIAQIDVVPAGLYLATDDRSTKVHLAGLRAEGYIAQAGYPYEISSVIIRSPEVLEQCVNALCGSLVDFTETAEPVLGAEADPPSQYAERKSAQDGILAFQREWNRYLAESEGRWADLVHAPAARARLANILVSALKSPTAEEAAVFGNWVHEDNFGSSVVTRVLPEDLAAAVPYLSPGDLDDLHMRDSFWPALLAASDTRLSAAAKALSSGLVDLDVFETSGEPFETSLRYRTGDGKWHDGARRRVRINHNGLSFARMSIEADDAIDISLAIPGRPAIVRVDWIEAKVISGGRRLPHVLRWESAEDFAGLVYAECRWLGANLMEFDARHAAVWLPLAARAGAPVTSAQITVAFAMLPQSLSNLAHRMPPAQRIARITGRLRQEYRNRGAAGIAASATRVAIRKLAGPQ